MTVKVLQWLPKGHPNNTRDYPTDMELYVQTVEIPDDEVEKFTRKVVESVNRVNRIPFAPTIFPLE